MRSRTFREGSVGLLLLLGLGVFGVVLLWLNRFTPARSSYKVIVEFANAGGMQKGAVVRYRGVKVGSIATIRPGPNNVEVEIDISQPDLLIPRDVTVEANQSGLISESIIDITPRTSLANVALPGKPLDQNCDRQVILCNGSRLQGNIGISIDELIRSSNRLATLYTQPEFYRSVNETLKSTSIAATQIAQLTRDLSSLTKTSQRELGNFSSAANSVERAANNISASTNKTVNQLGTTANQFGATASQFGTTAKEISATANQANRLLGNLDSLVTTNRSSLVGALKNITQTSDQLRVTLGSLSPAVNRLTQGELLQNLESLSANAAQASANLRDVTKGLNDPNNVLVLQKTLDSARVTFENTQKITSDLDELTGDPKFRNNLRQLVNGLSGLVSSTQQMQQDVKVANTLDSLRASIKKPATVIATPAETNIQKPELVIVTPRATTEAIGIFPSPAAVKNLDKNSQPTAIYFTTNPNASQEALVKQLREHEEQRQQEGR
jgi:phospholipid/cholesterol/gamma-HCH transport system substrate-binding protein